MLKVTTVGCGKIADQHAEHIAVLPGCKLIAVRDREELMALQLSERYAVASRYTDVYAMLAEVPPDVVHITTRPQSHHAIAKLCLEADCLCNVAKPLTMTYEEALDLVEMGKRRNEYLPLATITQYSHAAREMSELIRSGYLGGPTVHIESYYS